MTCTSVDEGGRAGGEGILAACFRAPGEPVIHSDIFWATLLAARRVAAVQCQKRQRKQAYVHHPPSPNPFQKVNAQL